MITHIVYYATYKDEIVYIGTGDTNRYKHVKSGTSHVFGLNELYFKDKFENTNHLKVYIYRGYTCPDIALKDEVLLIQTFKPCFNIRNCSRNYVNYKYTISDMKKYCENQDDCYNEIQDHLDKIKTNKDLYQDTKKSIESGNELFFKLENDEIVINEYWQDYVDYKISETVIVEKSSSLKFPHNFNIELKVVNAVIRSPAINDLINTYNSLLDENDLEKISEFLQTHELFNEWISSGVTTAMMHTLRYSRDKISQKAYELRTIGDNESKILKELNLEVGTIYSRDEILSRITDVYQELNISTEKLKASEIKKWYEIKSSPKSINGKNYTAYKILSKL